MTKFDTTIYRFPLLESVYKNANPRLAQDLVIMRENFLIPYYRYLDSLTRFHIFEGKPVEDTNALFTAIKKEIDGGTGIHGKANLTFIGKIVEKLMPAAMADKFFKGLPDPATSQPVQNYDAQAQKAISAMPPKAKADAQQLIAVGKKNAKLQGYIVGALTVGSQILAKFGGTYGASMGIPPQLTGAVIGAISGGLIAGIAAKMYGKPWGEAFKQGIKGALAGGAAGALGGLLGGGATGSSGGGASPDPAAFDQADNFVPDEPSGSAPTPAASTGSGAGSNTPQIAGGSGGTPELGPPSATTPDPALQGTTDNSPDAAAADQAQADNYTPNEPAGAAPQMTAPQVMQSDWFSQLSPEAQQWMGSADKNDPFILQRLIQAIPNAASVIPPELISQDAMNAARGAVNAAGGPNVEESREINVNRLVEQGIVDANATILTYRIAEAVGRTRPRSVQLTNEGIGDMFKKAGSWLKTKAQNATQTVTVDKLNQAWMKAGSPSDSDQIADILKASKVPDTVIAKVYADMGLPAPGGTGAAQGGAGAAQGDELDQVRKNAGMGAFGQMAGQLASAPTTSSTGGTTTGVSGVGSGVVKHTANPNNPNMKAAATPTNTKEPSSAPSGGTDAMRSMMNLLSPQPQKQGNSAPAAQPAAPKQAGAIPKPYSVPGAVTPTNVKFSGMAAGKPAAQAPAAQQAAPEAPQKKHTGGKVAGQVSQTPNAIRKRDARAQKAIAADRERLLPDYGGVKESTTKFYSKFLGIEI